MAGAYRSVFKGRGIEFEDGRVYEPGDDVRSMDWKVTARTGVPHVKRFIEEREQCFHLGDVYRDFSANKPVEGQIGAAGHVSGSRTAWVAGGGDVG